MYKRVLISGKNKKIISSLNNLGIETVEVNKNKKLDDPVACHADCAAMRIGDTIFVEQGNVCVLQSFGLKIIPVDGIASPYPDEVKLNGKVFDRDILCNTKYIAESVKDFANCNGYNLVHCNQGYAACSTFKVDDRTAVTDDETVYCAFTGRGIDCLYVNRGSVRLEGYDCGFIGGCCGMIDKKTVIFAGDPLSHSDGKKIVDFLSEKGIKIIKLFDGELVDFGGFINLE